MPDMTTFLNICASERLKMSRSHIWLLMLISPMFVFLIALTVANTASFPWENLMLQSIILHAVFMLPVVSGLLPAFICRYEHTGGGWKQLLTLPVARAQVYFTKFVIVMALLAFCQLLALLAILGAGLIHGIDQSIPWSVLLRSFIGGWVACLPLVALQLGVSLSWSSFAAPLAINVAFTIPNLLIVNSGKIGPFYPWAQPLLAMMPKVGNETYTFGAFNLPLQNLMITVLGSFLLFLTVGLLHFCKKEI